MFLNSFEIIFIRLQISDTGEYTCAPQGPGLQNKTVFLEVSQVVQRYCNILTLILTFKPPIVFIIIFMAADQR